jgi:hypothetical protein
MKKIILPLVALLMATTNLMASDVLFKMAATTSSSQSVAAGEDLDLASYYHFYVGGSALVHNGKDAAQDLLKSGCARLGSKTTDYFQITLPAGVQLQEGDVITINGLGTETNTCFYLHNQPLTRTAAYKASMTDFVASYTVTASDVLNGNNVFYVNYGDNTTYVQALTVSRANDKVSFYSFENEAVRDFESEGKVDLGNGLQVNSDGASTYNGIKAVSGKPNALFLKGKNANRAAELTVSGACKVEVWAWAASTSYFLAINEGSYAQPSEDNKVLALTEANVITKGEKSFNGTGEHVLYITPSGGFYIAAIRVTETGGSTPTGLDSEEVKVKSVKMIENGQLIIIRDGVKYNAQGLIVK